MCFPSLRLFPMSLDVSSIRQVSLFLSQTVHTYSSVLNFLMRSHGIACLHIPLLARATLHCIDASGRRRIYPHHVCYIVNWRRPVDSTLRNTVLRTPYYIHTYSAGQFNLFLCCFFAPFGRQPQPGALIARLRQYSLHMS